MKVFIPYKNIRRRAMILGLPLSSFALQMISVITSLLLIIFSFSLLMVIGVPVLNAGLYVVLLNLERIKSIFFLGSRFPKHLSNKPKSNFTYNTL